MKVPDYTRLDNFIRESLKAPEHNLQQVDWSELDVLLKHETKSIPLPNKKYFFLGGGALVLIAGIFFLIKFISSYKNTAEEEITPVDTVTSIMPRVDSAVAQTPSVSVASDEKLTVKMDTAEQEVDSVALALQEKKADSLIADFKEKEKKKAEEEKAKQEKTPVQKEIKKATPPDTKAVKKTKISALAPTISDAELTPDNILPPDTAGKSKPQPVKIVAPTDSTKNSPDKKGKKNKKGKASADSSKAKTATPPAKSDSLK